MTNTKFCRNYNRRRGVSLILTVSVMMLLSVASVTYIQSTTYERAAAGNYLALVDAKLTAFAGLEKAIRETTQHFLNGEGLHTPVTDTASLLVPLAYPQGSDSDLKTAARITDPISLCEIDPATDDVITHHGGISHSGLVGPGRYEPNGNFYSLQITDNASGLNINSHVALNTSLQSQSDAVLNRILSSLATRCGITNPNTIATQLSSERGSFKYRFDFMEDLETFISDNATGSGAAKEQFLRNLCTDSWIDTSTSGVYRSSSRSLSSPPQYYRETRAPVDINSISQELLAALIENLYGVAIAYQNEAGTNTNMGTDSFGPDTIDVETKMDYEPHAIAVDFGTVTAANILNIAQTILLESGSRVNFNDFAQFEKRLDDKISTLSSYFPSNSTSWITTGQWQQICLDVLKSNFNPNVQDNYWNPNVHAYKRVCKGDLFINSGGACLPRHTTELCFFSLSGLSIQSVGWITISGGTQVISLSTVSAKLEFGEILQHTLQTDFGTGSSDTITSPVNRSHFTSSDSVAGAVEPAPVHVSGGLFNSGACCSNMFPSLTYPKLSATRHMVANNIAGVDQRTLYTYGNNLAHDGMVSRMVQYPLGGSSNLRANARYFADYAYSSAAFSNTDGDASSNFRTINADTSTHIANYEGTIEFWVKLDQEPGNAITYGLPCALFAACTKNDLLPHAADPDLESQAGYSDDSPYNSGMFHEGVQMYCYINSLGQLRVSRLYYGFTFRTDSDTVVRYYGARKGEYADGDRTLSRRDVEIEIGSGVGRNWKAHEWHHVRISWDDGSDSLEMWLDGSNLGIDPFPPAEAGLSFCVLNELDTRDVLFINGFYREEVQASGYFHFATVVDYPGNATIDEFISYDSSGAGQTSPNRYPTTATYSNSFTMPRDGILGPIWWISYPTLLQNYSSTTSTVTLSVSDYQSYSSSNDVQKLVTTQTSGLSSTIRKNAGQNVAYTATLNVATVSGVEVCPILDSVSLALLYTSPKILSIRMN